MNRPIDAERILGDFLAPTGDQLPDRVFEATFLEIATVPQRRTLRLPFPFSPRPATLRIAGVLALLAIAVLGAAIVMTGQDVRPTVAPTESPAQSPGPPVGPLNTLGWQAYTSERYGFELLRAPDWTERPSDHVYAYPDDAAPEKVATSGAEGFAPAVVDGAGVLVTAWSFPVAPGTTLPSLLDGYCKVNTAPCDDLDARMVPVETDDGRPGGLVAFEANTQAFFLAQDRAYTVAVWRPEGHPSVAPYGGARRLVEGLVSTMSLLFEGPASEDPPPLLDATFTSKVHGYSIDYPGSWTPSAATVAWNARRGELDERTSDQLLNDDFGVFRIASTALPDSVDTDIWIGQWMTEAPTPCAPERATLAEIVIDGQPGRIRTSCGDVEATVVAGGRAYMFTLFDDSPTSGVSARAVFEAMIATVRLTPGTATRESPGPSAAAGLDSWTPYASGVYTYAASYPSGWSVDHLASRAWDPVSDQFGPDSPALDTFVNPEGTARVSTWQAPHDPADDPGLEANLLAWIEDLCVEVGDSECAGIPDRAVRICRCGPDPSEAEFVVPFRDHVMAFFAGTPDDTINIVTVWLGDDDPAAAPYGGAIELLYAFLAERGVIPAP
jgi:hypothetical protein